jgi:hypothetical protein
MDIDIATQFRALLQRGRPASRWVDSFLKKRGARHGNSLKKVPQQCLTDDKILAEAMRPMSLEEQRKSSIQHGYAKLIEERLLVAELRQIHQDIYK